MLKATSKEIAAAVVENPEMLSADQLAAIVAHHLICDAFHCPEDGFVNLAELLQKVAAKISEEKSISGRYDREDREFLADLSDRVANVR